MRRALVASTVAVVIVSAGGLTPATGAVAARYQKLAGTTLMTSSEASVAEVVLPKDVRVWHPWFDPDKPDFSIEGPPSGVVMFALVAAGREDPALLLGGRLPEEASSAPFLTQFGLGPDGPDWGGYWDLPAGRYRLYLFTDGPSTLTLSLAGISGRTKVVPGGEAGYEAKTPQPVADHDPVRSAYFAGAEGSLDGPVAQFQVLWKRESVHASTHAGYCWYDGAPPERAIAYLPGCPTADSQDVVELTGVWAGEGLSVGTGLRLAGATGESGQGAWFMSAAAVSDFGHQVAWLDLGLR